MFKIGSSMKIVLTGANGQLGRCFKDRVPENWHCYALSSEDLDISNTEAVLSKITELKPDFIVNAAAYTAVDKAETDPLRALQVNSRGPENLAIAAKEVGCKLIHVSTDYVFEGNGDVAYKETDSVLPLGVYGKTKLSGELVASSILPSTIIIRTAWVFSEYGNNFVKTMLRLAKDRTELSIVADQIGCPTYAGDIASAIIAIIDKNAPGGIYHYCGDDSVSWAKFAEVIFEKAYGARLLQKFIKVNSITSEQYPTPAVRPKYSVLSTELISHYYPASNWKRALDKVIELLSAN